MRSAKRTTKPVSLRALGVGRGAVVALLLGSATVGCLAHVTLGAAAGPLPAATFAAVASAVLAIVVLRTALHRAIVRPVARCVETLELLRDQREQKRLPEGGAPCMHELAQSINTAVAAVTKRDGTRTEDLQACESAFAWDHMVLESLRDAVIVLDAGGRVVSANASALGWFELHADGVRGRSAIDLLPGEPGKALGEAIGRITTAGASEVQTTGIEHGRRKLDLDVVSMQPGRAGRAAGIVASFADVTRTHELAQLRDDLLSSISHELRTPLTNLCSSSDILIQIDPAEESDWRDFVEILHSESHRLKNLVDDVMSYQQVENSRAEWHFEPHDAGELARTAEQLTSMMTRKAGIGFALEVASNAAMLCDGPRILEVLVRLVDNACKFGHRGGHVRLHVQAFEDRVEFALADDGPGILPADRQRVFERFVQVGDVLTDKPRGAGLGLSICQRIVDATGGTIWCEDSPLGGIQVRFMLPLARGKARRADDGIAAR